MEGGDIQQHGNLSQGPGWNRSWPLPPLSLSPPSESESCVCLVLGPECESLNQEGGRFHPSPDTAGSSLALSRSRLLLDIQAW